MNNPILAREPFVSQAAKEFIEAYPGMARALNGRIEKAIDLAASSMVFDQGVIDFAPTFFVKSLNTDASYTVQGRGETWQTCSCLDNRLGNRCQHGLAIVFALRAVQLEREFRAEWDALFHADEFSEETTR